MKVTIELNPKIWLLIARSKLKQWRFRKVEKLGGTTYTDSDLVYAAYARCLCGAGLAFPEGCGGFHYWDCSDILTGRAALSGTPGALLHQDKLPFAFYEIKSERANSARGVTTRGSKRIPSTN